MTNIKQVIDIQQTATGHGPLAGSRWLIPLPPYLNPIPFLYPNPFQEAGNIRNANEQADHQRVNGHRRSCRTLATSEERALPDFWEGIGYLKEGERTDEGKIGSGQLELSLTGQNTTVEAAIYTDSMRVFHRTSRPFFIVQRS
ncbi:hypothetical protein EVAR_5959_1 [Eumeta japonica]|uniref:Uncharacterized protein n=1 Tax=Eumeta variegata TaxID=151549 RepID=A0A4C1TDD3_EUMVA|nr:hypothetical protein EVAR_5959_1 [Eumeta japonica]